MTKKQEMVTIEVPVEVASKMANHPDSAFSYSEIGRACRAALEARRTKLERWRENLFLPWVFTPDLSRNEYPKVVDGSDMQMVSEDVTNIQARLMAAAPQLLWALMRECSTYGDIHSIEVDSMESNTVEAIRAALPEDVAAEVLGDE